ncbi:MAG: hypothetical protein MMC33_002119 [Icmadophila ericetorum]|nr:hypothetical protein [Icmadophila ericetorum]
MHSSAHKHNKLSLFKPNRSQASLLSSQDARSYQGSPIDSPLQSPAFPPPASISDQEPGVALDNSNIGRPYPSDPPTYHQSSNGGAPRRSQSQRSPPATQRPHFGSQLTQPTIHLVGPTQSSALETTRIDEDPDTFYDQRRQQQGPQPNPPKVEKEKRRFFGFGKSSSSKESAASNSAGSSITGGSQRQIGRSTSVAGRKPPPETRIVTNINTNGQQSPQPYSPDSISAGNTSIANEAEEGNIAQRNSPYGHFTDAIPTLPPKDPIKSPRYPPSAEQEQSNIPPSSQNASTVEYPPPTRTPTWDRVARPSNHHRNPSAEQVIQYPTIHTGPPSATSISSHNLPPRGQDHSQLPYLNSRPSSRQSYEPPSPSLEPYHQRISSTQGQLPYSDRQMPSAQSRTNGRGADSGQQSSQQGSNRNGDHMIYIEGPQGGNSSNGAVAPPQYPSQLAVNSQQSASYRGNAQTSPMLPNNALDQDRGTPPLSRSRDNLADHDTASLQVKYEELNEKYRKVKRYYFDKETQVQQLQNTLAHQRLAQSRTSLDDNGYQNRFHRLDGAINDLAFNIRKDWKMVPPWLAPYVNKDANTTQSKEMTAVGRACISKWLVDSILDRFFHPSLDATLSCQLKNIERNLRRFAPPMPSEEEREALTAKISNWRLATLDGLQDMLASHEATENRNVLTNSLVHDLTSDLTKMLKDPPPAGLEANVVSIVELTIGIASNLPLESRDVFVDYVMPGTPLNEVYMKVEGSLPQLTNPGERIDEAAENMSLDSQGGGGATEGDDNDEPANEKEKLARDREREREREREGQKKKGVFGGLMANSKKPSASGTPPGSSRGQAAGGTGVGQQQGQGDNGSSQGGPKEERVRFSSFLAVEVRGRSTLMKAPVYL